MTMAYGYRRFFACTLLPSAGEKCCLNLLPEPP